MEWGTIQENWGIISWIIISVQEHEVLLKGLKIAILQEDDPMEFTFPGSETLVERPIKKTLSEAMATKEVEVVGAGVSRLK